MTIPGVQRRDRTTEPPELLLARRDHDHPEARALLQALHAEQLTRYGCRQWAPETFEITRMYIAPDHRGRGFGRSILQRLEEHARGAGARRTILETGARNAEALGLYAEAGYHPIPTYAEARDPEVNRAFGKTIA